MTHHRSGAAQGRLSLAGSIMATTDTGNRSLILEAGPVCDPLSIRGHRSLYFAPVHDGRPATLAPVSKSPAHPGGGWFNIGPLALVSVTVIKTAKLLFAGGLAARRVARPSTKS